MSVGKTIKQITIALAILLVIQLATYHLFAPGQLESQLLTGRFGGLSHASDSAFVRDFYVTDCGNTLGIYISHDLQHNEEILKKKLNVKFIQFQNKEDPSWDNPDEEKYKLTYHTWIHHADHWTLYDFFSATQTEELLN